MPQQILIVGAGLAGASAAWCFARQGHDCTLIEQGEQPGAEASAQNAGMLRRLEASPRWRALAIRGARLLAEHSPQLFPDGGPFQRTGGLVALAQPGPREQVLAEAAAELRLAGLAVLELRGEEAAERFPALAGARLHRAWLCPEDGTLDAHQLLSGLLRAARPALRLGLQVQALHLREGRCAGLLTDQGLLRADRVVIAAGAWSRRLAAGAGLARPLHPLARHLFKSDPDPRSKGHPWCWIDDAGLYIRPEGGGWLVSPCDEAEREPPFGPGSRGSAEPLWRARASELLALHLPALADLRLPIGWTGLRTFTPERRPLVGQDPELPGLSWLAGLGGHGLGAALAAGEELALGQSQAGLPAEV
jgi:glycine/D-amino acid oxidase-like deaminating enzyme